MADYYPLIARAVAGLDKNTGENRRALYERARTALVNQLRSVEPALEESDITRERLALEEAIRKVEAEAAKRARPDARRARRISAMHSSIPCATRRLRSFRDTVAEAEGLGDAAAKPTARRTPPMARCMSDSAADPDYAGPREPEPEPYFEPPAAEPQQPRARAADEHADPLESRTHQPPDDAMRTRRPTRGRRAPTAASSSISSCCCWCWRASPAPAIGSATTITTWIARPHRSSAPPPKPR